MKFHYSAFIPKVITKHPFFILLLFVLILGLSLDGMASSVTDNPSSPEKTTQNNMVFSPKVDARGFVDVWQLREDVAKLEAIEIHDESDTCSQEGDMEEGEASLTEAERRQKEIALQEQARKEQECVEKTSQAYAAYKLVYDAFNNAWLPVLMQAMKNNDPVAEVILRQCSTTSVINRSAIETTCSGGEKQKFALSRLRKIGFIPAIPIDTEPGYWRNAPSGTDDNHVRLSTQQVTLNAMSHGNFGSFYYEAASYWQVPNDPGLNYELLRNALVIQEARSYVDRAFLMADRRGDAELPLRLNNSLFQDSRLRWGNALIADLDDKKNYDRLYEGTLIKCTQNYSRKCAGKWDATDRGESFRSLFESLKKNVDAYLAQDPRWAVFLLKRIGSYEWLAADRQPPPTVLDSTWLGEWVLVKHYVDFVPQSINRNARATISVQGDVPTISIQAGINPGRQDQYAGLKDVSGCALHLNGGLTKPSSNTDPSETLFGDLRNLSGSFQYIFEKDGPWKNEQHVINGLEAFKNHQQYQQLLMQCAEAENNDETARARFLLNTGDTLVEVAMDNWWDGALLHIRHYVRADDARALALSAEVLRKNTSNNITDKEAYAQQNKGLSGEHRWYSDVLYTIVGLVAFFLMFYVIYKFRPR